ncbi:MAG: acyl carrier protein [Clostridiales bacterium]|jgi:acyl carrier protein|uniref:acyl carrier protein n=1 Tax=Chordicoccus furentiruminis TaxID=2709410 RepID=UPI0023A8FF21|nr:acyl carrier protein [Chordicoccus furentiruminis]MCI6174242.1 acyl carrier protein [Clostridiales bacterium]
MSDTLKKEITDMLMEIDDSIDYEEETHLVDDHLLDSFGIITLIADLEDRYGVSVNAAELVPENLNSVDAICEMVRKLKA